ncbi:hypothetical protein ACQ4PT_044822 [Festuca glaucescens]
MVAPGLTVGGWFAGVVIANFVGKVRSIMEDHHGLRAAAGDMLYNVEGALPRIKILVEVTERKAISNRNFAAWLQQFKDVVSEAEDLLDDFETKRIQEMLKSKVSSAAFFALKFPRNLVLSDDDLQRLKVILTRLDKITGHIGSFHDILKLADTETEMIGIRPPTSQPVVVGRDEEKQQLLNRIFPIVPPPPRDEAESNTVLTVIFYLLIVAPHYKIFLVSREATSSSIHPHVEAFDSPPASSCVGCSS